MVFSLPKNKEELHSLARKLTKLGEKQPRRNEPCYCGSGKKYKFCCYPDEKVGGEFLEQIGHFSITDKFIQPSPLSSEDSLQFQQIMSHKERPFTVEEIENLKALVRKYPDYPVLYNNLCVAYQYNKEKEKLREAIQEFYKLFPNNIFARTAMVALFLETEDIEKAEGVLENKHSPLDLEPDRNTFHYQEIFSFFYGWIKLYAMKGQIKKAETLLNFLQNLQNHFRISKDATIESAKVAIIKGKVMRGYLIAKEAHKEI